MRNNAYMEVTLAGFLGKWLTPTYEHKTKLLFIERIIYCFIKFYKLPK